MSADSPCYQPKLGAISIRLPLSPHRKEANVRFLLILALCVTA